MRRISAKVRQRKRQTWLDLPVSGIEEVGNGQISTEPACENCQKARGECLRGIEAQSSPRHTPGPGRPDGMVRHY